MILPRILLAILLAGMSTGCAHFRGSSVPNLSSDASSAEVQEKLDEVKHERVVVPTELLRAIVSEKQKLEVQNRELRSQLRGLKRVDLEKD